MDLTQRLKDLDVSYLSSQYDQAIDWMMRDTTMAKNCRFYLPNTFQFCDNCIFSPGTGRSSGRYKPGGPQPFTGTCPICYGHGGKNTNTEVDREMIVIFDPKEWFEPHQLTLAPQTAVQTIGKRKDVHELIILCENVCLDISLVETSARFKRMGEPRPLGLFNSRYVYAFWERIGN